MTDASVRWEITQNGSTVRMTMLGNADNRMITWCEFPPEMGYELAQNITLKCIQCEEAGKANGV